MGKGTIKTKAMTMAVAMSMVAGLCPSTVFAANSEDVAKVQDGTYTGTAECTPDGDGEFTKYNLSLSVTVEDGKIKSIDNVLGDGDRKNKSYIGDATDGYDDYIGVVKQIVDANGTDEINAVSGATCSSNAIVNAVNDALEKATKKDENTVKTDGLQTAITKAESLTENDYGADSWKSMQDALTAAKDALEKKESQTAVDTATTELTKAIDALVPKTPDAQKEVYVLMNIPYADFYKADGVTGADTVSSATKQKTRASLASGSYHVNSDGSDITGVTFPVKISDGSVLEKYTQVTDESEVTITTNIKGKENTVTYKGQDALFESASYSYYTLSDTPSYYKEATVNADGSLSFSEVKGTESTTLTNATTEFSTSSRYGDYQLDITSEDLKNVNTVYGVVVSTKEGSSYGLRHVENIWKKTKLAWSTGFVTESHGNTLDSKDYAAMMGQTINKVTYYTDQGIYEIPMDQQVAKKFDGEVSVADVSVKSEKTAITVSGLPNDFEEEYKIDGIDEDAYSVEIKSDGKTTTRTINFKKALAKGRYTVTLSDKNGNYAPISTIFNVYTETMPVKYNEDDKNPAVVKNDNVEEEEFQTYLKNITSVTVNGKEYAASGKKEVKLIKKEDGKLDLEQDVFKDAKAGDAFAVTIAEDGYQPYTFTYKVPGEDSEYSYVYVGMSWAEYWANEGVYNAGSIEASDVKDSRDEYDKGAFDTVTRATTNHGLHRGSFQCTAVIEDTEGKKHYLSHWEGKDQAVMTDGTTYTYAKGVFTAKNGSSFTQKDYEVTGLKYVPVKIRTADLNSLKEKYTVVENGGELIGGYGENQLKSYKTIADVTANTNGLKTAEKQEDGSFAFSARTTGSYSGLKDTQLATADVTPDVKAGDKVGSYGEFIRVDFNGNYGGLGSAMQAVEWTYYGNDDTYTNPVRVFGTKFASDNWMHKSMGIQLGLTDSLRCQLPENTNGTGYWKITIYGLGYADYSYNFEVGTENIATLKTASAEEIATLQAKIDEAKALNRFAYTTDSWKKMQDELEESEVLLKSENPLKSEVNEQVKHLTDAIDSLVTVQYVLMNIPYAEFYKAETTGNDIAVDAFTSATKNKTRTKGLAGGSYHENADGSKIDGITYAVKVDPSVDLSKYKEVKDGDSVEITVTNRGQTTTTTLTGKDTLFENASYAYYPLTEAPANYKEVSVDADGNLVFSEVKGQEATKVEGVTAELLTETSYGDYELDLDGLPEEIKSDNVNAVVVKTTDGTAYGMRHLENIWRGNEIAWSTGFTSEVHGCPTSSEHYKSMMGKTIDSIEYYTTNGVYTMDIADIYVPVKSETTKSEVADADIAAGKTTINVQLPDGFDPEYSVDGLDVSVEGNVLTFKAATESRAAASVKPGKYTLTIKDKNKKYADVVTTFTLTTKDMPAAYDEENKKLVEAEGFDIDALKAYLGNITSVNVNGKDYAASGRGSVVIINKDGTIKTDADPFKDAVAGTEFQITVASTGYTTPLTFTYKIAETPAPAEVDTTALEAAIAEADNLKEADYTADSWAAYQAALQNARTVLEAKESQEAVNQALSTLNAAKDALVKAEEEPVAINTASLEKAIADAKALKEADYTAESWKALQSALSDARKALEAKESQEAVDNATNSLNKAIKALVKKGSSSVKKTDGTTNGSKTSGSDSVKTGDPASVLGWLGLAVSSLGAGMGGFAWKRRKRK
ncbi:FMN-binding protein [Coprococcus comes]|uniref:penicillin-binding Tp47 domain C-containing protein n=1 Tax=Coprococcus comes TaxID=410072 RepID=UPI001571125B|nr:penicillin-binding Tp47 domain C-containing protein [Coprococcus comes]NSC15445.1 FMN-binding protein [Coprococcus comes]NSC18604.1 FMN-binding protein [Coprococcus comes]NSC30864.1 FMN-binding protein [Coprococcus comes]NSC68493.1 FMN-binding protein [Coprococcus comes]NSC86888.1 FMN-binding protein [Coprococcus comes]